MHACVQRVHDWIWQATKLCASLAHVPTAPEPAYMPAATDLTTALVARYWAGYTVQNGQVANMTGGTLGAMNSSLTPPYMHFLNYVNSSTMHCVAISPRHPYQSYKWWWVVLAACWCLAACWQAPQHCVTVQRSSPVECMGLIVLPIHLIANFQ